MSPLACKVRSIAVRKVYAYARGENSEDVPASAFKAGYKTFADSGFRLRSLLKGIVEDKEFFSASPPETTSTATKVAAQ